MTKLVCLYVVVVVYIYLFMHVTTLQNAQSSNQLSSVSHVHWFSVQCVSSVQPPQSGALNFF